MTNNIIPFGKYKGDDISEVITKDPQYIEWLKTQDWLKEDFKQQIINININKGLDSKQDSPEHNKLQLQVYNKLKSFVVKMYGFQDDEILSFNSELEKTWNHYFIDIYCEINVRKKIKEFNNNLKCHLITNLSSGEYEETHFKGVDDELIKFDKILGEIPREELYLYCVRNIYNEFKHKKDCYEYNYHYLLSYLDRNYYAKVNKYCIFEVKPSISDDFMNYIRQIQKYTDPKSMYDVFLCYKDFKVSNLTLEEVTQIFKSKEITLVKIGD